MYTNDYMKTFSVRIEESEEEELLALARQMKSDKSTVARKALELGIREMKIRRALENIRLQKWTVWKAAEYCGESYRSFLKLLRDYNIPFPISVEELEREMNDSSE